MAGVTIWQPEQGYRYSSDSFWLAGFALDGGHPQLALDLGTGSGIIAFLLAGQGVRVLGIDVQGEWEKYWRRSFSESKVMGSIRLEQGDVDEGVGGKYDLVVSNPPFFPRGAGALPSNAFKAAAKFESSSTLARFVEVGLSALLPDGRFCLVIPAVREDEVVDVAASNGAGPARWVRVNERRTLMELNKEPIKKLEIVEITSECELARRWYALACGTPPQ